MSHRIDKKCHHIWILYPAGSVMADFDSLIRLASCFASRQSAYNHMARLRRHWEELPDANVRDMAVMLCRDGCPCESEAEVPEEVAELQTAD